jgi:hypothetical protein
VVKGEAKNYFSQYKGDGEYYEIIGGPSPSEYLKDGIIVDLNRKVSELQLEIDAIDAKDKRIEELEKDLMQAIEALEIIAGRKQCFDNTMSNVEIAKKALAGDNDE